MSERIPFNCSDASWIEQANKTGRQPVLFIHGLWLHPSSWNRWTALFEEQGYVCRATSWPEDLPSVAEAREDIPGVSEELGDVAEYHQSLASGLDRKPIVIGHSFGGLIAQLLADRGVSAVTVAIAPAAFRGVLPLPLSELRSASPVLLNPANRKRRVGLTSEQFRYAFGNALPEQQANELYEEFAVPAPGGPLFEAAFANLNPWSADQLDPHQQDRGPLMLIAGEQDHTVPAAVVEAEFKLQRVNPMVTEFRTVPARGHSLTIDSGWKAIAEIALDFCGRFKPASLSDDAIDESERESFPASDPPAI